MIRRLLLAATMVPFVASWAQQGAAATEPTATAQELQVPVPTSRIDLYAGLRSNGGTDFMMGFKYSHRRPEWKNFGAGGFVEVVFASQTEFLFGALAQFYPTKNLILETGPGFAVDGGSDFFWRVGGEYQLQTARLVLIPKAYFDFIHGTTVFGYGLAIGARR
jgi:hypothetical protein